MMHFLLMIQSDMAAVQTAAENMMTTAPVAPEKITFLSLALKGGWIMALLMLLLILALYISIERYITLRKTMKADTDDYFMSRIRECIHGDNIEQARTLAKQTDTPLGRMINKGLSRLGRPLTDIQAAIENEGQLEVSRMEKGISLVATVASLGPMLGFLGTVTGMVTAFQDMAHAGNNIDISVLATGIYEAMVTTIGGLVVGIIAYFLHNVLVTRISKVVFTLEARATEFMDLLHEPA